MRRILKIIVGILTLGAIVLTYLTLFVPHRHLRITRNESTQLYQPGITTLNFPLYISINDLEKVVNLKLKRLLADKKLPMKNKKDSIRLRITRLDDIQIQLKNSHFHTTVPLKLEIAIDKHLIGKTRMQLFREKPIELYVTAGISSDFQVLNDLKVKTNSTFEKIQWDKEPAIKIAGMEIDLKDKIDASIQENSDVLTHKIDSIISQKINLKKPVRRIWNKLQKSIKASKKQEDLFIRIQPEALGVFIDKSANDSLKLDMIVTSKMYLRYGEDTSTISKVKFPGKITLLRKNELKNFSQLYVHALLPLKRINNLLQRNLQGKDFETGNFHLKIRKIEVINGTQSIYVQLKHGGTVRGTVVLRGFPTLSDDHKRLEIHRVSFENQSEDEIINSMTDLLHSEILDALHDYTSYDISEILESLPEFVRTALSRTKLAQRADIDLEELKIETMNIKLTRDNIQLLVSGRGNFDISLKETSFKVIREQKSK